jgi:hypothetical protein
VNRSVSLVSLRLHCIALHCIALHALGVGRYLVLYPIRLAAPDLIPHDLGLLPGKRRGGGPLLGLNLPGRPMPVCSSLATLHGRYGPASVQHSTVTVIMGWAGHAKSLLEREEPNGTERNGGRAERVGWRTGNGEEGQHRNNKLRYAVGRGGGGVSGSW